MVYSGYWIVVCGASTEMMSDCAFNDASSMNLLRLLPSRHTYGFTPAGIEPNNMGIYSSVGSGLAVSRKVEQTELS